ncbi:MAG TPA: DUF397 domain-containing protein [Micromonosporaceae bacterium]|nr:DUF397 domain-containing protein [Micromonosporaceae bacterium]
MDHPKGAFDTRRAVWRRAGGGPTGHADDAAGTWAEGPGRTSTAQADPDGGQIEIAFVDDLIGMRNSADPDGPILVFTESEWEAFVAGTKDGEFDV